MSSQHPPLFLSELLSSLTKLCVLSLLIYFVEFVSP